MNLRDRARRLFGREQLSEHTVVSSKVEHAVFSDVARRSTKVAERLAEPPMLDGGAPLNDDIWQRLGEDVWSEFYGLDTPTIRGREKIADTVKVNRELTVKQARDDGFAELHAATHGDVTTSALAWLSAMDSLAVSYDNELAEHGERANDIAEQERTIDDIDDALEALRQQRRNTSDPQATDELIRMQAQAKREAVDQLKAQIAEQAQHAGDLIDAAKHAAGEAVDAATDTVEVVSSLPGSQAGADHQLSPDAALEFAARVHDSSILSEVLKMLGRIETSMSGKRRELRKGGYEEMVDIETGDDLRFVLPQERALLTHPVARLDFYRRYHERALMQYEMWSEEELHKGPLIFCTDGSGSMSGAKNVFARGMTLASCLIAHREGRNAAAVEFGSDGELHTFFFPKEGAFDTTTALDFAEHFFGGGTDINGALAHGLSLIENEAPFHTADLVVVTDGQDHVTDETTEMRDELRSMGVKLHGFAIGIDPTTYLLHTCDNVSSVFDFAGPNQTTDSLAIDIS
jgi:uncharacterized protein with von Willebrand factor type A (vWA) domain